MNADIDKTNQPKNSQPLLPRFITKNNSHCLSKSVQLPTNEPFSKNECFVLRTHHFLQKGTNIIGLDSRASSQLESKTIEYDTKRDQNKSGEKRLKNNKRSEERGSNMKILTGRFSSRGVLEGYEESVNQRELQTHRKFIDTTMRSLALEREKFKETIRKEIQHLKILKQISPQESYYTNSKILHERKIAMRQRRNRNLYAEDHVKLQDYSLIPAKNGPYDVRPWTNNLNEQL